MGDTSTIGAVPTPPPRAWLIDLDGTLYRPGLVKLVMGLALLTLGLPHFRALARFRKEHERLRREQAASPELEFAPSPFQLQLARTAEQVGRAPDELERVVRDWMVERPGPWLRRTINASLVAEIREFRAGGGRTALVSDYPASPKLDAMGIRELFDAVIANGETDGLTRLKPAPDGFLLAARTLGVSARECLVVGDREDADGAAAAAAGMSFRLLKA